MDSLASCSSDHVLAFNDQALHDEIGSDFGGSSIGEADEKGLFSCTNGEGGNHEIGSASFTPNPLMNYQPPQQSTEVQLPNGLQNFNSQNTQRGTPNGDSNSHLGNNNSALEGPSVERNLENLTSMYWSAQQAYHNVGPKTTVGTAHTNSVSASGQQLPTVFQQQQQQHWNQLEEEKDHARQPQKHPLHIQGRQSGVQQFDQVQLNWQQDQEHMPQHQHTGEAEQQHMPQHQQEQQHMPNYQQVEQHTPRHQQCSSRRHEPIPQNIVAQQQVTDHSTSLVQFQQQHDSMSSLSGAEKSVLALSDDEGEGTSDHPAKKQRVETLGSQRFRSSTTNVPPSVASHNARNQNMPEWMRRVSSLHRVHPAPVSSCRPPQTIYAGSTLTGYRQHSTGLQHTPGDAVVRSPAYHRSRSPRVIQHKPTMLDIPADYVATWEYPIPSHLLRRPQERRRFELSLINVKEFTITGLPLSYEGPPSSLNGLRKKIKELSKDHGNASYERGKHGIDGRWRIPLGAYESFFAYLSSEPMMQVIGIPQDQLKIASLGKARLEKGYPSVKKLISLGVPRGLATALAPFQRGGVDFVVEKGGRALLADEMGLGKTVQGIASMSVFHNDWPILVLTPSSARYHWEHEFQQWLGRLSPINSEKLARVNLGGESDDDEEEDDFDQVDESNCMELLEDSQIHVLASGKDAVLPSTRTKVVICSYGLAPALVDSGKIYPGLFRAAIVDESHMLKNMSTKRTKNLVPVLHATNRCILLSGTPALAKPSELWPQLKILSTEETGWWEDENAFLTKYVKNSSTVRRAELHAMLTGTVMIRRLKNDILKSLPKKMRGRAVVDVSTPDMRKEFHKCMGFLREGKGQLGMLARQHSALGPLVEEAPLGQDAESTPANTVRAEFEEAKQQIINESEEKYTNGVREIDFALRNSWTPLDDGEKEQWKLQRVAALKREVQVWCQERIYELEQELPQPEGDEISRKSVLNRMYSLTGKAKLPLISSMIMKWLADTTKGKLCVFAHHIFVLDELVRKAGLSNSQGSHSQFIRIDGSTSPKERQAQIKRFQQDPNVRIAILGITAAGVAVTLTASSTVWFAELFWTPALMIQAEDRCHRIGQNARVNCLYFVATGTLDDLLWKLLEKKFKDLGEFVEGQEKQKIVVHKTYHGTKDLDSMFVIPDGEESEEEVNFDDESDDGNEILKLEHDLEGDIELLGREELTMIKADGDDDEVGDDLGLVDVKAEPVAGTTEEEAILLSDDEVDAAPKSSLRDSPQSHKETTHASKPDTCLSEDRPSTDANAKLDIRNPLQRCRGYSILFEGDGFGMMMFTHEGRAIVGRKTDPGHELPAVGDALIAVNGQRLPFSNNINQITHFMKSSITRGPVELTFVEIPALRQEVRRRAEMERKQYEELKSKFAKPISSGPEEIIEILDD